MSEIKLSISQSRGYEETEVKTISSREVAEMMEVKKHSDMLAKIDKLNEVLANGKIRSLEYWFESEYSDAQGKPRKEYQVTKKGCELLAHKSTGEKGVIFTVKYMERFEQMEQHIKKEVPQSYAQALLEAGRLALENEKQQLLIAEKNKTINILTHTNKLYTATKIAKELGFKSATELNKRLCEDRIQFKQNGTYVLYSNYARFGYDSIKQEVLDNGKVVYHRKWTQIGREFILNKYLECVRVS